MAAHRVYVIWTHPLFHESVKRLLDHPDVEWVGATSNSTDAMDEIQRHQPDTILVEEITGGTLTQVMEVLDLSLWDVRVVGLSMDDNQLRVYERKQWTLGRAEDLLHLVLQKPVYEAEK